MSKKKIDTSVYDARRIADLEVRLAHATEALDRAAAASAAPPPAAPVAPAAPPAPPSLRERLAACTSQDARTLELLRSPPAEIDSYMRGDK